MDCTHPRDLVRGVEPWAGKFFCTACECHLHGRPKEFPEDAPTFDRVLNRMYAERYGYFWIACALCGGWHGGHEEHGGSIPTSVENTRKVVCINCKGRAETRR